MIYNFGDGSKIKDNTSWKFKTRNFGMGRFFVFHM